MRFHRRFVLTVVAGLTIFLTVFLFGLFSQDIVDFGSFYRGVGPSTEPQLLPQNSRTTLSRPQPFVRHTNISLVAPANSGIQAKVIILTYMRSGSSLTGDLFNHHARVFYVYEPLWMLKKWSLHGSPVFFFNRTARFTSADRWFQPTSVASDTVKAVLTCDLYALDLMTLSQHHMTRSRTTAGYYTCTRRRGVTILGMLDCLPLLFKACGHRDVTVVKTIRFSMQQAASLMNADPKIKVIHLIRDPRPTLQSQISVGEFQGLDANQGISQFCQRVLSDLRLAQKLKPLFPGRILTIRYEDLAKSPLYFAEKVLGFAGLSMDRKLREYVWNITSAGFPDSCTICTTRRNSWKTATAWRSKVNLEFSRTIDERCKGVYRRIGYLPLSSREKLLDVTVPSFLEYSRVPGLWV